LPTCLAPLIISGFLPDEFFQSSSFRVKSLSIWNKLDIQGKFNTNALEIQGLLRNNQINIV
jgi:hypothetical protein